MSRYINADKLKKSLSIPSASIIEIGNAIMAQIDDIPTADVRENVRGEWIERKPMNFGKCVNGLGSIFKCSVCGEEICCTTNYCPNCGADMRGEA